MVNSESQITNREQTIRESIDQLLPRGTQHVTHYLSPRTPSFSMISCGNRAVWDGASPARTAVGACDPSPAAVSS
jgi:hypothetical protein